MKNLTILIVTAIVSVASCVFVFQPIWGKISNFRPWSLGLDIAGGASLIYDVDLSQIKPDEIDFVLNGLRRVIERRVNLFGVSEPKVFLLKNGGRERLAVELAGIRDISSAIREIGETPFLEFREIAPQIEAETETAENNATLNFIPTSLNGRHVKAARISFDSIVNKPVVLLGFNSEGVKLFAEITERNIGKPLAIFLDGEPIQVATVQEKIEGGDAQLTGNFSLDEVKILVERFNAGALPAPVTLVDRRTVSPELGVDSINKAVVAGVAGTIAVVIFMIIYYRLLGAFASVALIAYILIVLGVFKLVPITMTLSGVAGFLLSIGMAVDANILVFERMKEETERGLAPDSALEEGFRRAWASVRDSNISTIITALVLYYFTSSFVRGFALTLLIGVVVSMISAITISRSLLRVVWLPLVKKYERH